MPYYMRTTDAGRTREVEKWRRGTPSGRTGAGAALPPPSREELARVNRANALRRLRLLVNANFGPGDFFVTFTYRKGYPVTRAEALRHYQALMRALRGLYAAQGVALRYVAVTEEREGRRPHHHAILPEFSPAALRRLWPHGHINIRPLDDSGQYHRLALYLFEHTDTPGRTGNRWKCSQGLTRPKPSPARLISAKGWRVGVPKGWVLDVIHPPEQGCNPYTGAQYLRYTLLRVLTRRDC